MIDSLWGRLQLADFHGDALRNVVSRRVSADLFDDLVDTPAEQATIIAHEMAVKPPHFLSEQPVVDRPFEEAAWYEAIGFPFEHWQASRYSLGRHGVWYGADTVETTIHETVYHWRRFLADAGITDDDVVNERRVHAVRCDAALLDLRPHAATVPELLHSTDYTFCQQFGHRVHREGHPGLITRSARCEGEVYAVFNPAVLSNPRAVCYLTYRTRAGGVDVEREPGIVWFTVNQG